MKRENVEPFYHRGSNPNFPKDGEQVDDGVVGASANAGTALP